MLRLNTRGYFPLPVKINKDLILSIIELCVMAHFIRINFGLPMAILRLERSYSCFGY